MAGLWLWQIRIKKYVAVAVADLIDDEIDPCFAGAKEARMMKLIPLFFWSKGVHQATGSLRPVKTYKIRLMK